MTLAGFNAALADDPYWNERAIVAVDAQPIGSSDSLASAAYEARVSIRAPASASGRRMVR